MEKKHGKRITSQHVSTGKRTWPWNHYIPEHPTPRKLNRQAGTDAESFNHPRKEGHISNVMCPIGDKMLSSYSQMYSMQELATCPNSFHYRMIDYRKGTGGN